MLDGLGCLPIAIVVFAVYLISSIKILAEYERGVIFRLGRLLSKAKGPGLVFRGDSLRYRPFLF